jgi:hypothetical protein
LPINNAQKYRSMCFGGTTRANELMDKGVIAINKSILDDDKTKKKKKKEKKKKEKRNEAMIVK